jgi:hypothetical protein
MKATRSVHRSVLLAGFAMLNAACEDPCGMPSGGIELFAAEGELPAGTYEIEITDTWGIGTATLQSLHDYATSGLWSVDAAGE